MHDRVSPRYVKTPASCISSAQSSTLGSQMSVKSFMEQRTAAAPVSPNLEDASQPYKLYRRRFVGLFGLSVLNIVATMPMPWFGPIANNASAEFGISLDEVNWLGNCISCACVAFTILTPWIVSTFGVRRCCDVCSFILLLSAWIRYAGTVSSLSSSGSYALLVLGQLLSALPQASFVVLGPKYSQSWFNTQGRTTATMTIAIANSIGSALGQFISPIAGTTRHSILVLAVITTASLPCVFLISDEPPTPPTHAAAVKKPRTLSSLMLEFLGRPRPSQAGEHDAMTLREKLDFIIVLLVFSMFVGIAVTFSVLSAQWLSPYGYSSNVSGLMGAAFILAGVISAVISAPLLDRVFTNHMSLGLKSMTPIVAIGWLSLIWAVRENNSGALYTIFAALGVASYVALPIGLEIGVEVTRAPDASSALLWSGGNLFAVMFVLAESAMRGRSTDSPPLNMRNALILQGILACTVIVPVMFLRGEQKRRKEDEDIMLQLRHLTSDTSLASEPRSLSPKAE